MPDDDEDELPTQRDPELIALGEAVAELGDAISDLPNALDIARSLLLQIGTVGGKRSGPDLSVGAPAGPSLFYYATDRIAEYMVERGMSMNEVSEILNFLRKSPSPFDFRLMAFGGRMYEFIYYLDMIADDPKLAEDPRRSPEAFDAYRRDLLRDITILFSQREINDPENPVIVMASSGWGLAEIMTDAGEAEEPRDKIDNKLQP